MFVCELAFKGKKLPGIEKWINPNYPEEGEYIFNKLISPEKTEDKSGNNKDRYSGNNAEGTGITGAVNTGNIIGVEYNNPNNWKEDFPKYHYQYPELQKLKKELNEVKHKQDIYNEQDEKNFRLTNTKLRDYDLLRGKYGILAKDYDAEIVTNAWLKMFENMAFLDEYLKKISKSKNKSFYSLHIAEAPGNFVLAINHYIKTNYPQIDWFWLANSYRDIYDGKYGRGYLSDQYGLIRKNKHNWIFGADGDGDITSTSNLISFNQDVRKKFLAKVHFITSDVKYVPEIPDFDDEEYINKPVHLAHLVCSLMNLENEGVMILKEFTLFEAPSIALLYLIINCFRKVYIAKPETSKSANSEIYIIGIKYKNILQQVHFDRLLSVMKYIRKLNVASGSPALFVREDIPETFVKKVIDINRRLNELQISGINKNIETYEKYKSVRFVDIENQKQKIAKAREWINKHKVTALPETERLLVKKYKQDNEGKKYKQDNEGKKY
jgi:23S rRNA U2552 (ribose-2'-O)-methylase RlmE/FtsJ